VLEAALFKPFGKPLQHPIYLDRSELVRLGYLGGKAAPVANSASSVRVKPLPESMIAKVAEALRLMPDLRRTEQYAAVRKLPRFKGYRITDKNLRQAGKSAPVPLGRPRK